MKKEIKLYLIIGLVVLFLLVAVYFLIDHKASTPKETDLPNDDVVVNENTLNEVDKFKVEQIIDSIFNDIDGVNTGFGYSNIEAYRNLLALSDTLFVFATNVWLRKYFKEYNETLRMSLMDENTWNRPNSWVALRTSIIERLDRLKIK